MPGPLDAILPPGGWARSRRWSFWVNHVAASPVLRSAERMRLLRRLGFAVDPEAYAVGPGCYFHSSELEIGPEVYINDRCYFENVGQVTLERGVGIAPRVCIITSVHEVAGSARRHGEWSYRPVRIGAGSWIGTNAVVHPGVTVGSGCIVGAGSVVTRDLEPNGFYGGVPAQLIRRLEP